MKIEDIAKEANVSISTVSRVINKPNLVNHKTRQRVEKVIKKYNFIPHGISNNISNITNKNILIFSSNILHHHFASSAYALDDMFTTLGYNALIYNTTEDVEKIKQHFRLTSKRNNIEGVILLGSIFANPEIQDTLNSCFSDIPIVISNGILSIPNTHSILIDHRFGIKSALNHLVEKGHKKIGLVHSRISFNAERKINAFHEVMNKYELPVDPESIFTTPITVEGGEAVANRFLKQKCDCTALIFLDDIVAVGAMNQFQRKGIKIPDEIAIIGHDNSLISQCSFPSLTTIDGKSELLATVIGNTLNDLINKKPVGNTIMISPELVVREST